jgi:DNA end-binding protein Ku
MAPRAVWKGVLEIGIVTVPVKMFTAQRAKDVAFRELHATHGARLRHVRVCEEEGDPVTAEETVRGVEVAPGEYVVVPDEQLEALRPEATRTIAVERFVEPGEIPLPAWERTYHLGPDTGGARAYAVLAAALAKSGLAGVGTIVMRGNASVAAVRPFGGALAVSTLRFADELVDPDKIDDDERETAKAPTKRELEVAQLLVSSLSDDWDHSDYHDTYRERVLELVARKDRGEEIDTAPPPAAKPTDDLLAALEASLKDATTKATPRKRARAASKA